MIRGAAGHLARKRCSSANGLTLRLSPLFPQPARATEARPASSSSHPKPSSPRPQDRPKPNTPSSSTTQTLGTAAFVARQRKIGQLPTAKAKAQASASRALRQQLASNPSSDVESAASSDTPDAQTSEASFQANATQSVSEDVNQAELRSSAAAAEVQRQAALAAASVASSRDGDETQGSEAGPIATHFSPRPPYRLREVVAYATAECYDFDVLFASGRLPSNSELLEDGEVIYVPSWPSTSSASLEKNSSGAMRSSTGEAFIFRNGSYVTWGMSPEASRKFLRAVIRGRKAKGVGSIALEEASSKESRTGWHQTMLRWLGGRGDRVSAERSSGEVEVGRYEEIGDEGMDYVVAEDQITRLVGDVIVIGQVPPSPGTEADANSSSNSSDSMASSLESAGAFGGGAKGSTPDNQPWTPKHARVAFSQGLARSARLSVQELALSAYLESVAPLPALLEKAGKVPLPRRDVVRKMGTLLRLRQRANLDRDNFFDAPEVYWENGRMEYHYDSICEALDIEERFRALNEKLDHCENLLGVLRALLTEGSSHRMELIIIYLIAFEAFIALISHDYIPSPVKVWRYLRGLADPAFALRVRDAEASAALSVSAPDLGSSEEHGQQHARLARNAEESAQLTLGALHSALAKLANAVGAYQEEMPPPAPTPTDVAFGRVGKSQAADQGSRLSSERSALSRTQEGLSARLV